MSPPSIESSFFVGGEAGRQSDFKQSDGDLKFAERIGLRFFNKVDFDENQASLFSGKDVDDDYNNMVHQILVNITNVLILFGRVEMILL